MNSRILGIRNSLRIMTRYRPEAIGKYPFPAYSLKLTERRVRIRLVRDYGARLICSPTLARLPPPPSSLAPPAYSRIFTYCNG